MSLKTGKNVFFLISDKFLQHLILLTLFYIWKHQFPFLLKNSIFSPSDLASIFPCRVVLLNVAINCPVLHPRRSHQAHPQICKPRFFFSSPDSHIQLPLHISFETFHRCGKHSRSQNQRSDLYSEASAGKQMIPF